MPTPWIIDFLNKFEESSKGHEISLVGIDVEKELVYYLDPNDESDPMKQRNLYRIPYKEFCNYSLANIVKLGGFCEKGQVRRDADFGYSRSSVRCL